LRTLSYTVVVAFTGESSPIVGWTARKQASENPGNTIFSVKGSMGLNRKFTCNGKAYTPPEISSIILSKVRYDAEKFLGERIESAVITVPAYFNDRQRQDTREAGKLAGIEVLRIINEPTSAALAYGLDREDIHTVLILDLGGGTFDVSILELGEGIFEVRAVSGDTNLGGDDFDARVIDWMVKKCPPTFRNDILANPTSCVLLRSMAEKARIELSSTDNTRLRVPVPGEAINRQLQVTLHRKQLKDLTEDLIDNMVKSIMQALSDARMSSRDIDRVILVGGATRMPMVRDMVRSVLEREPYRYIDPDKVVACGAAIQAGMLTGIIDRAVLLDVLPLSLGLKIRVSAVQFCPSAYKETRGINLPRVFLFRAMNPKCSLFYPISTTIMDTFRTLSPHHFKPFS